MTLELVLIGFGNVGRRFVRLLDERADDLARHHDFAVRIVGIATRSHGQAYNGAGLDGSALAAAVEAGDVLGRGGSTTSFLRRVLAAHRSAARERRLVVVETTTLDIKRGQPATQHVRDALARGAHVTSANKGPAAFAYHALASAARRAKRSFFFESAVLDGVPLFNLRRAALPAVKISGFQGVVNSTTNYILTALEQGTTFGDALAAMQRAGIAEADPTLDVDGWDAAAKTAVLANALMGARLTPHAVEREAVTADALERTIAARAAGRRLKLVASAEKAGGVVRGRVRLTELPESDLLARLEGQQNAIILQTDLLGEIAIVQLGGGLTQTAYGLLADLVAVRREIGSNAAIRRSPRAARPRRSLSKRARR
jgi:homoserine dehydrogenase